MQRFRDLLLASNKVSVGFCIDTVKALSTCTTHDMSTTIKCTQYTIYA